MFSGIYFKFFLTVYKHIYIHYIYCIIHLDMELLNEIINFQLWLNQIRYKVSFILCISGMVFFNSLDFISLQRTCTLFVGECKIAFKIHLLGIYFSKIIWGRWVYMFSKLSWSIKAAPALCALWAWFQWSTENGKEE